MRVCSFDGYQEDKVYEGIHAQDNIQNKTCSKNVKDNC